MIYNILSIGDIHWGAMDYRLMYDNLSYFIEFIKRMKDRIDLVVICGDYFDYRLQLSSKTALTSIKWFDEFVSTCKSSNVKKIRIVKGTKEHDNDQLEAFRPNYVLDDGYIKIFNTCTIEDTFPDLKCIYCSDENITLFEFHDLYLDNLLSYPDIGFFHGNFDIVLPSIKYDEIVNNKLPSMIFQYDKFSRFIKGPLISSHWHIPTTYESLYYIGSYDRWMFGEVEDKGFMYCQYNTSDNKYKCTRIKNPFARDFITITRTSDECYSPSHFAELQRDIISIIQDDDKNLKVKYLLTNDNEEGVNNFSNLQKRFMNSNNLKLDIQDLVKKAMKKKKKEETYLESSRYGYIFENPEELANNIQKFILDRKGIDLPLEIINKYVNKYKK